MKKTQPGSGPARKRKQHSGSHCPGGSGASAGPSSSQKPAAKIDVAVAPTKVPVVSPPQAVVGSTHAIADAPAAPVDVAAPQGASASADPATQQRGQLPDEHRRADGGQNHQRNRKQKPRGQGRGPQPRQARDEVQKGTEQYRATEWYLRAVKTGFRNRDALNHFNACVRPIQDQIEHFAVPVCSECGASEVELCEHFVVDRGVESNGDAVEVPAVTGFAMRWRFQWVNRVRRMFTWPRFDSAELINHYNNGFDPSVISDTQVWPEMLMYIRLNLHTHYKIDGEFNREAKLAHCNKLALRFLTDNKVKQQTLLEPTVINMIKLTVARACDQRDDQTLLKEVDPRRNFWLAPGKLSNKRGIIILALTIASPRIVSAVVCALLKLKLSIASRLVKANAEILANGSVQALKYAIRSIAETITAFLRNISSGLVRPFWSVIRQLLCRIANTMSMNPFIRDISRRLPTLNLAGLTTPLSGALSLISPELSAGLLVIVVLGLMG